MNNNTNRCIFYLCVHSHNASMNCDMRFSINAVLSTNSRLTLRSSEWTGFLWLGCRWCLSILFFLKVKLRTSNIQNAQHSFEPQAVILWSEVRNVCVTLNDVKMNENSCMLNVYGRWNLVNIASSYLLSCIYWDVISFYFYVIFCFRSSSLSSVWYRSLISLSQ